MLLVDLFYYIVIIYLVYKGIIFVSRLFAVSNKKSDEEVRPSKSKFKDVEEADFTEIKDDKDKDKGKDSN
ncbi:MAG: hypothetical protein P4L35_19940 [Ignavibacteriaceae bacterium]|nr:hypothetical protein [Ignavibacteriaceae bacterium]